MSVKKKKSTRISQTEMLMRKRNIAEWIMEGNMSVDIVQTIQDKWNLKERQAYYYIESALALLYKNIESKLEQRLAFHVSTRLRMYKQVSEDKALKARERYALMLAILQDVAKLEGLYQEKIKIEHETTENIEITLNLGDSGKQEKQIENNTIQLPTTVDNSLSKINS